MSPDRFWTQSPRSFVAVMKGRAHAAKAAYENAIAAGYYSELFARQKKLKTLSAYLAPVDDAAPVAPELVLDAMLTLQAQGVPMKIRKVE
ncbi:hypothetical protein U1872_12495 [Sphingomonas sp. RB3P16]|uniref:hypothetical protein n=1 Tax=Parasphingomonas frigoris TaxID=3096163 RepID=UPI002FC96628